MLSLRAIASRLREGDVRGALEIIEEHRGRLEAARVYPLAWLALRAWSAILNVFGAGVPPATEVLSQLEVRLTSLAVEARILAERGVVDEKLADELVSLLIDDRLVSLLRSCRGGACNPRAVMEYGELFRLLGEVLAVAGGADRDCIPG